MLHTGTYPAELPLNVADVLHLEKLGGHKRFAEGHDAGKEFG